MKGFRWIGRAAQWVFDLAGFTDRRLWSNYSGPTPAAGVPVNESIAMTYSAVWAATRIMCLGGCLPLHLYDGQEIEIDGLGRESKRKAKGHALSKKFAGFARPGMPFGNFRRLMWADQVNWGNGIARKILDYEGQVDSLWRLEPWRITPTYGEDGFVWRYSRPGGGTEDLKPSEVFHVPNIHTIDGVVGIGTIAAAREAISMGLATEKFGANFFGGDGIPRIVVEHPGKFDDTQKKSFREEWSRIYGGPDKSRVATLGGGAKANAIQINAEDSQFLGTREFNIEEIARWYGIPPHMIQRMIGTTLNNVEALPIDFVRFTLQQYLDIWEGAIRTQLVPEAEQEQFYAKHNVLGFLRGDSAAQIDFIERAVKGSLMTRNEGRAYLELEPVPGGDIFLVQGATVPLDDRGYPISEFAGTAGDPAPTDDPEPSVVPDGSDLSDGLKAAAAKAGSVDVQATALNGAQVSSLLAIIDKLALGDLPKEGTRALIEAAFPATPKELIDTIVTEVEKHAQNRPPAPAAEVQPPPAKPVPAEVEPEEANATETRGSDLTVNVQAVVLVPPDTDPSEQNPPPAEEKADDRIKAVAAGWLRENLGRMATKEIHAAERAAGKPDKLFTWMDDFYGKHEPQLAEAITAPLSVIGVDPAAVAKAWCHRSREELLEVSGQAVGADLPAKITETVRTWKSDRLETTVTELVV